MSADLYVEEILEHFRHPRNYGELSPADVKTKDSNPLCGDVIEMTVKIDNENRVEDIRFKGQGCAISQASASMLTETIKGKPLDELVKIGKQDILTMLGIEVGPTRLKCALLSLKVLKTGLYAYLGSKGEVTFDQL